VNKPYGFSSLRRCASVTGEGCDGTLQRRMLKYIQASIKVAPQVLHLSLNRGQVFFARTPRFIDYRILALNTGKPAGIPRIF